MIETQINDFLNQFDYDIRKSGNARWIDQKCTPDNLEIIADCILEFTNSSCEKKFKIRDIWNSEYANENITDIFKKPSVTQKSVENEYDKYFSQPINLFVYSGILKFVKKEKSSGVFKIENIEILEFIAKRRTNSLKFLILYITKVLQDSDLYEEFEKFFKEQTKDSFNELKNKFCEFTIENTRINGRTECARIFTKVLNPLAFHFNKKGTCKGYLSKTKITLDEIMYNRVNFRDEYTNKDKDIARKDHIIVKLEPIDEYRINKAKRIVRKFNDKFNNGISEIIGDDTEKATQIHHIFSKSSFPIIADYLENLIAITPNQHFSKAHPNNNTAIINRDFQYVCLLAKTNTIMENLNFTNPKDIIYSFDDYRFVLNVGLNTDKFSEIENLNFAKIIENIDIFYSDYNKYENLAQIQKTNYKI